MCPNRIRCVPCTTSLNDVRAAGTLKRTARGAPTASSSAMRSGVSGQTEAIVLPGLAALLRLLALLAQPLRRAVAVVRMAFRDEAGRRGAVTIEPL